MSAPVQVARNAMATRFEIALYGEDAVSLRAAAEEALDEVQRLENQLSLYRPDSEISHLNARASDEAVRVPPELFRLLEQARRLHDETEGAFDITIGPLMRAWGFVADSGHLPDEKILEQARQCVGMHHLQLDPERQSVHFARKSVMLDLGAIGKGYAIEKAAEILREAGVCSALIHGGTSTAVAIGCPPGEEAWKIAVERPPHPNPLPQWREGEPQRPLAVVPLRDNALSVSAVWGKSFQSAGVTYGHVIDPRTGAPASKAVLAAVSVASATESDALSTALLTLGIKGEAKIAKLRPGIRTLVVEQPEGPDEPLRVQSSGIKVREEF